MPALEKQSFDELIARGCDQCGRNYLKVRALASGSLEIMEGESVSSVKWKDEPLHPRVYRVDCSECGANLFSRDDCPLCQARGSLARALEAKHGIRPPSACARCGFGELTLSIEARQRVETILGRISRRVAESELHEPGLHVVEARCRSCEEVTASAGDAQCAACGRSRLLKRIS